MSVPKELSKINDMAITFREEHEQTADRMTTPEIMDLIVKVQILQVLRNIESRIN